MGLEGLSLKILCLILPSPYKQTWGYLVLKGDASNTYLQGMASILWTSCKNKKKQKNKWIHQLCSYNFAIFLYNKTQGIWINSK